MAWSIVFRLAYAILRVTDPLLRAAWRRHVPLLGRIVDLSVVGRRSGRLRSTLVTLLTVDERWYVGHPNGAATWTMNLTAAGRASVVLADGFGTEVRAVPLFAGPEREAVIRATWSQQPFPANLLYAAARRRVRSVGVYFRLIPLDASPAARTADAVP